MHLKAMHSHHLPRNISFRITMIIGILIGVVAGASFARMAAPTEHMGLEIEELGFVPAESVSAQVGLKGYKLLLRRITINPGGQIAKHSAESTPGVVYVESGTWTEGRDSGETEHTAGDTFVEDENTVHWFFNRGDVPASAYVCDIKPS